MSTGFSGFKNTVTTISMKHQQVHQGTMFSVNFRDLALAGGASIEFLIVTPITHAISLVGDFGGDKTLLGRLYEDTIVSANGTAVPAFNRSRTSDHVFSAGLYNGPTVTDDGAMIADQTAIAGKNAIGSSEIGLDWALKPNANYMIRLTNNAGQNAQMSGSFIFHDEIGNPHRVM